MREREREKVLVFFLVGYTPTGQPEALGAKLVCGFDCDLHFTFCFFFGFASRQCRRRASPAEPRDAM